MTSASNRVMIQRESASRSSCFHGSGRLLYALAANHATMCWTRVLVAASSEEARSRIAFSSLPPERVTLPRYIAGTRFLVSIAQPCARRPLAFSQAQVGTHGQPQPMTTQRQPTTRHYGCFAGQPRVTSYIMTHTIRHGEGGHRPEKGRATW